MPRILVIPALLTPQEHELLRVEQRPCLPLLLGTQARLPRPLAHVVRPSVGGLVRGLARLRLRRLRHRREGPLRLCGALGAARCRRVRVRRQRRRQGPRGLRAEQRLLAALPERRAQAAAPQAAAPQAAAPHAAAPQAAAPAGGLLPLLLPLLPPTAGGREAPLPPLMGPAVILLLEVAPVNVVGEGLWRESWARGGRVGGWVRSGVSGVGESVRECARGLSVRRG